MKPIKTITISLPVEMGKEIQKLALQEHRTVSELIRESFRQYKAQRNFKALAKKGKKTAKGKKLTTKDFPQKKEQRKPGIWKGKVSIKKDFDTLPEEFIRHFN